LFITTLFFAVSKITFSQNSDVSDTDFFIFKKKIPGNFSYFNVDMLNNIFLISQDNQLLKLNESGDFVAVFNELMKFGKPSLIDVSNPLKILVYYKNYGNLLTLDKLLSVRNSINLKSKNLFSVRSVAASYDNNIWVYDEQYFKIKKFDDQFNLLLESPDISLLAENIQFSTQNTQPSPVQLLDYDKQVFLYDKTQGFYIFDSYGSYKNNLPFKNWNNVAINNKTMYGFSNDTLFSYNIESLSLQEYKLPSGINNFKSIKAVNGNLYILKKDGLEIYQIK
jgi:hypothetical protein